MTDPNLSLIAAARAYLALYDGYAISADTISTEQLRFSALRVFRSDPHNALANTAARAYLARGDEKALPRQVEAMRQALADELAGGTSIPSAAIRAATSQIMARIMARCRERGPARPGSHEHTETVIIAILEHLDRVDASVLDEVAVLRDLHDSTLNTEAAIAAKLLRDFGIGHAPSSVLFVLKKIATVVAKRCVDHYLVDSERAVLNTLLALVPEIV